MLNFERDINHPVTVVEGAGAGDEGKGKIVDAIVNEHLNAGYEVLSVRGNGGGNAGHTVEGNNGVFYDFHQIPSGVAHPEVVGLIGNGFLNPVKTLQEIKKLEWQGLDLSERLVIGSIVRFVLPHHIQQDTRREMSKGAQGSTGSGIAFVAADKSLRECITGIDILEDLPGVRQLAYEGLRQHGLARRLWRPKGLSRSSARELSQQWACAADELRPQIEDTVVFLHEQIKTGKLVDIEAAQGFSLDVNHGKIPWTTSDHTISPGILANLGIPPKLVNKIIGVYKILPSKVGGGPFPTREQDPATANLIAGCREDPDGEFGVTTGRPREVGYPDLPLLRRYAMIADPSALALTKFDKLNVLDGLLPICSSYNFDLRQVSVAPGTGRELMRCTPNYENFKISLDDIKGLTTYSELDDTHKGVVDYIEQQTGVPVKYLGTGPGRHDLIRR
jgi:adenylosuccinate synthase